jgi:hypothetical protein
MQLKALKPLRWPGRRLQPGEVFDVRSGTEAQLFKKLGLAEDHEAPPSDEREPLRQRLAALGAEVDRRWGVDRLLEEIAAAEQAASRPHPARAAEAPPEPEPQAQPEEPVSAITTEEVGVTPSEGHYHRRDMQAEDR